ncbi:efflux RND transporter periplasmic adaptor subunit [Antarcticirhabdus aurantiaca]|uniref:Efflux RND transporter periplasmic adaptor subunit n=1 Tax=Antarcticirhabdus aurantiaca TaxID=2606717 RepID=A0ACD4NQ54_9HYPH|nr:efflux RND transporter periplasmic adaptor subunit [Antarcticirhabdus aurantiaca]WAJ28862.1 efflux RND transporter periplasmic adaptor subunit [Jeongeuplla avenae]
MKPWFLIALGSAILVAAGGAVVVYPSLASTEPTAKPGLIDARTEPPMVATVEARRIGASERAFTGSVAARIQSNLGFRVPGKIVERLVDAGDEVKAGQPLMRIDERDLHLALTARSKAADAARAVAVQARADEKRYATLLKLGQSPRQRYEQAKAALDSAEGQLSAAEAEADVARNEAGYAVLVADADGSVVETLGEPGQVVSAGQAVVRLAHDGQREATVSLPETVRPAIGSQAEASVYGLGDRRWTATLRQLSSAADAQTRTYEARFVLDGEAADAPIGSTVTVWIKDPVAANSAEVPIGAILDENGTTGVWVVDRAASKVSLRPVTILELGEETATVSGLEPGTLVAALGAHLLHEGAAIRLLAAKGF